MRFRFCRDCDCPDWLLAEILTLSKINVMSFKEFTLQVCSSILTKEFKYDSVLDLLSKSELDSDVSTVQACTSALHWIISNAVGSGVEPQILNSELQQLGLPKDQGKVIEDIYGEQREALRESLKNQSLKVSSGVKWSFDIKSIEIDNEKRPLLQLNVEGDIVDQQKEFTVHDTSIDAKAEKEKLSMFVTKEQLGALIHELEDAYDHMKELKTTNY